MALLTRLRPDFLPLIQPVLLNPELPETIDNYLGYNDEDGTFSPGILLKAANMVCAQAKKLSLLSDANIVTQPTRAVASLLAVRNAIDPGLVEFREPADVMAAQIIQCYRDLHSELEDHLVSHPQVATKFDQSFALLEAMQKQARDEPALRHYDFQTVFVPDELQDKLSVISKTLAELNSLFEASRREIGQLLARRQLDEIGEITEGLNMAVAKVMELVTEQLLTVDKQVGQVNKDFVTLLDSDKDDNQAVEQLRQTNTELSQELTRSQNRTRQLEQKVAELTEHQARLIANHDTVIPPSLRDLIFVKPTLAQVMTTFTRLYPDVVLSTTSSRSTANVSTRSR